MPDFFTISTLGVLSGKTHLWDAVLAPLQPVLFSNRDMGFIYPLYNITT